MLSTNESLAAGNSVAVFVPIILIPLFYFIRKPEKAFDWSKMLLFNKMIIPTMIGIMA